MDDHEHGPLSDHAPDQELAAMLAVEPSPEFRARVRARVAAERMRSMWTRPVVLGWMSGTAALMAVTGIWLAMPGTERGVTTTRDLPAVARHVPAAEREARHAPVDAPIAPPERSAPDVRAVVFSPDGTRIAFVARPSPHVRHEVLVSPDEAVAMEHLFDALNRRIVSATVIPDLDAPDPELPPIPELPPLDTLVVEPIEIRPLARLESE